MALTKEVMNVDKVEANFEQLEIALEAYRQSLKDNEDAPGSTARQYAKDATQVAKLRIKFNKDLETLIKLEVKLPAEARRIVFLRRQAIQGEYASLAHHHLTG